MTLDWGLAVNIVSVVAAVWFAMRKQSRDMRKSELDATERLTRMETKVDVLYRWWEYKVERRSERDIEKYEAAVKAKQERSES